MSVFLTQDNGIIQRRNQGNVMADRLFNCDFQNEDTDAENGIDFNKVCSNIVKRIINYYM